MSLVSDVVAKAEAVWAHVPRPIKAAVRTAVRTFLGAELVLIPAVLAAPDVHTQTQILLAGTLAAGAAAVRFVESAIGAYLSKRSK